MGLPGEENVWPPPEWVDEELAPVKIGPSATTDTSARAGTKFLQDATTPEAVPEPITGPVWPDEQPAAQEAPPAGLAQQALAPGIMNPWPGEAEAVPGAPAEGDVLPSGIVNPWPDEELPEPGYAPDPELAQMLFGASAPPSQDELDARSIADETIATANDPGVRAAAYAVMSPEERYLAYQEEDDAKERLFAEEEREIDAAEVRDNLSAETKFTEARDASRRESAELQQRLETIANTPLDQDRWMRSRTGGQQVALILAAGAEGFLDVMSGDNRNSVIEMMTHSIDQDIAMQRAEREAQLGAVNSAQKGVERNLVMSAEDREADLAESVIRLKQAKNLLAQKMSQYDPEGTAARGAVAVAEKVDGITAARVAEMAEINFNRGIKRTELELKVSAENRARAKADLDKRKRRYRGGGDGGGGNKVADDGHIILPDGTKYYPPGKSAYKGDYSVSTALAMGDKGQMIDPNTGLLIETKGTRRMESNLANEEARTEKAELSAEKEEKMLHAGPGGSMFGIDNPTKKGAIHNEDGTLFEVSEVWKRKDIADKTHAALTIRRASDLINIVRELAGGESDWLKSAEWQELQSMDTMITLASFKAFGLGAPSEGDITMVQKIKGGINPTSFAYEAHQYDKYATQMEIILNDAYKRDGYIGPTIKLPRAWSKKKSQRKQADLDRDIAAAPIDTQDETALFADKRATMAVFLKKGPSIKSISAFARKLVDGEHGMSDDQVAKTAVLSRANLLDKIGIAALDAFTGGDGSMVSAANGVKRLKKMSPKEYTQALLKLAGKDDGK